MKPELTNDAFFNGSLKIRQPQSGYRFSIDAILIASQSFLKSGDRVLDVGTGCGIISLILAYRHPDIKIFGIELQQELADIAWMNISENNLQSRIRVFNCDVKDLSPSLTSGTVDVVVCNPPHREANTGRINPDYRLAIARHEITMTIDDLIHASARMLSPTGRFIVIYPATRVADILKRMNSLKIEPKKLTMIHSKSNTNAIRCLIEGVRGGKPGITVPPPLVIYNNDGSYTDRVKKIFSTYGHDISLD